MGLRVRRCGSGVGSVVAVVLVRCVCCSLCCCVVVLGCWCVRHPVRVAGRPGVVGVWAGVGLWVVGGCCQGDALSGLGWVSVGGWWCELECWCGVGGVVCVGCLWCVLSVRRLFVVCSECGCVFWVVSECVLLGVAVCCCGRCAVQCSVCWV
jgi:hypothetical protein